MLPLPSSAARRTLAAIVAALAPRSPPALASTTAPLHLLPSCNKIAGAGPLLRGSSRASFRVCASSTIVPLEARLFSPFVFIPSERSEGSLLLTGHVLRFADTNRRRRCLYLSRGSDMDESPSLGYPALSNSASSSTRSGASAFSLLPWFLWVPFSAISRAPSKAARHTLLAMILRFTPLSSRSSRNLRATVLV